jgi:hypothetical protein
MEAIEVEMVVLAVLGAVQVFSLRRVLLVHWAKVLRVVKAMTTPASLVN